MKKWKLRLPPAPLLTLALTSLAALATAAFSGCSVGASAAGGTSSEGAGGSFSAASAATGMGGGIFTSSTSGSLAGGLGAACMRSADCGGLLSCLTETSDDPIFGGGPAGGFCTKACVSDNDCPGTHAACLKNSDAGPGRCTLTCTIGPPLAGYHQALDPQKCRGRDDLRCESVKGLGAVCLPTCGSDAQCGPGRACDPRLGVCVAQPSAGLATGAKCDPAAMPTSCAGRCVSFDPGASGCSSPCVLGGDSLDSLDCGGPDAGLCAFAPAENGAGDVGYCTPSCVSHADCQNPDFWCFSVPDFTAKFGKGYCFAATPCKVLSDCAQPGQACTATPSGSYCLDPSFPLQKPSGDGGAEDGGGLVDAGGG